VRIGCIGVQLGGLAGDGVQDDEMGVRSTRAYSAAVQTIIL